MTAHAQLAGLLRELMPKTWTIIDHERAVDEPDATSPATVSIKLDEVRRLPQAPAAGVYSIAWTVTISTPHVDPERADPAVFDRLLELVRALDGVSWLAWETARKVDVAGRYGFDITLNTHNTKEP